MIFNGSYPLHKSVDGSISFQFFIYSKPVPWYMRFNISVYKWTQRQAKITSTVVVIKIKQVEKCNTIGYIGKNH